MRRRLLSRAAALAVTACVALPAFPWGADGHSIVAEIAHRRLSAPARAEVEALLGPGHSLASEASWADDVRPNRVETTRWHFINIPIGTTAKEAGPYCIPAATGDCIVAAMERLRSQMRCGSAESRRDALRFVVHFIGDLHQPLHTVLEEQGGNLIKVDVEFVAPRCPRCAVVRTQENLHSVWDGTLISKTTWNFGAYVTRLEEGWLRTPEAKEAAKGTVEEWTLESHAEARRAWTLLREDKLVDAAYYEAAIPVVDRQLGRAGVRLAQFLEDTLTSKSEACPAAK